jgi:hypothetical protein
MKKLRQVLAAVLLTVPVMTLNAGPLAAVSKAPELQSTQSLAGTCYMYFGGRWIAFPC